jgi:hypothetical protein
MFDVVHVVGVMIIMMMIRRRRIPSSSFLVAELVIVPLSGG